MPSDYVLHIIRQEKFTNGHINFMELYMHQFNHKFLVKDSKNNQYIINVHDEKSVVHIKSFLDILFNKNIKRLIEDSNKVIVSGVFGVDISMAFLPNRILQKTYLQFWGGDYYCLKKKDFKNNSVKQRVITLIEKYTKRRCIKMCAAVILLIEDEYPIFEMITGLRKRHFIAPVGKDGSDEEYFRKLENNIKPSNPYIVLVGNSASETNNHRDALDMLAKYRNSNIKVICPLSYGSREYAEEIIRYGKSLFGNKFEPITSFLPKYDYYKLLADVKIAIFLNERQEAMGTINALFRLGVKVYLCNSTSMWASFRNKYGYYFCDVSVIPHQQIEEFLYFPNEYVQSNKKIHEDFSCIDKYVEKWTAVLTD